VIDCLLADLYCSPFTLKGEWTTLLTSRQFQNPAWKQNLWQLYSFTLGFAINADDVLLPPNPIASGVDSRSYSDCSIPNGRGNRVDGSVHRGILHTNIHGDDIRADVHRDYVRPNIHRDIARTDDNGNTYDDTDNESAYACCRV
jgi:hypothetical protein